MGLDVVVGAGGDRYSGIGMAVWMAMVCFMCCAGMRRRWADWVRFLV